MTTAKLITLALIGLLVSIGIVIAGCLSEDFVLVMVGLMGFALFGYDILFIMWTKGK